MEKGKTVSQDIFLKKIPDGWEATIPLSGENPGSALGTGDTPGEAAQNALAAKKRIEGMKP